MRMPTLIKSRAIGSVIPTNPALMPLVTKFLDEHRPTAYSALRIRDWCRSTADCTRALAANLSKSYPATNSRIRKAASWTSQRKAPGSRCIERLTIAFYGCTDIWVSDCLGHYEVHVSPEEHLQGFPQPEIVIKRWAVAELHKEVQVAGGREVLACRGSKKV
jgi:hypothetical protein